jgi:PAS domain S-box-containing protein
MIIVNSYGEGFEMSKVYTNKIFYLRFFASVFIILLLLVTYTVYTLYYRSVQSNIINEQLTSNIKDIAHYDEILTMSARMAVLTGDKKWIDRYNLFVPKLDKTINQSIDIVPIVNSHLKKVDNANQELISIETKSFELLEANKLDEARELIFGENYFNNKKIYQNGIDSVIKELKKRQVIIINDVKRDFFLAILFIVFLLLLNLYFARFVFLHLKSYSKKLEENIDENEQKMSALYRLSPLGIALTDMSGKYLEFNEAFAKICGYEKEELNELDYWELTPKKYEEDEAKQLELLSSTGFYGPYEKEYIRKDGSLIDIRLNGMLITDSNNQQFIWSIVEDISDQKSLQEQSESIAKIIDNSLNEVYIFDAETLLFTYINKGAEKNIGYSLSEMMSMKAFDIKPEIDQDGFNKLIEPLTNNTKEILVFETVHQRKDGSLYNVEVHLQLTTYKGKKQFVAIILDTTTRKTLMSDNERLESMVEARTLELKKATLDAENANKYKSEFLANMSHEIRTPMTGILGFVERLKKSETDPVKLKEFEIISASGNTLLNIINDILDFSKIESGKLDLEMHPVEIHHILTQICSIFKVNLDDKQISFIRDIDANLPKFILGDEVRLKQVIFNLLSNAIKFTPENGNITVTVKYNDSKLFVAVSDTGIGIAKDNLSHIFESFRQEDTSTTRKFGGTGLGLSISSSLVQKMGGELKVESELGKGSKLYFEIPIQIPDDTESKDENESSIIDSNRILNGTILVVEDNKTNQMLLGFILDELGVEYDIANDGVEAVRMYQENQYKLILMDENMPNMNGIEATNQIRSIEVENSLPKVPIVAVTANALTEDRQKFLDAGMDDYLSKPYQEAEMVKMVVKYLS